MQTVKLSVLVLVLVVRLCRAEVVIPSMAQDKSATELVKDFVTIVTSCYGDRIHGIGVAGDLPDALLRTLSAQYLIPMVAIDNNRNYNYDMRNRTYGIEKKYHKLPIFIVGASSVRQCLEIISEIIDNSIWGNHLASFFILDRSPNCRFAVKFLLVSWDYGIPYAKVMCYGDQISRLIVNFDPFASVAPFPWRRAGSVRFHGHPFTIFDRYIVGNETTCINLDFEKSKNFWGHPIFAEGNSKVSVRRDKESRNQYDFVITNQRIMFSIFSILNATPIFYPFGTNKTVDVTILSYIIPNVWSYGDLYPHSQIKFVIISHFRGNKSQLQKILDIIDTNSHIGLGIAYVITLIFFKFVVSQALVPAILNLIRITCGVGFQNVPRSNAPRIYLTGVLFFAVTMHGIFDGNLASLLTTVIPRPNVNSMKDVFKFNYTIYGAAYDIVVALEPKVKERYTNTSSIEDCIANVMHDKSSVCTCPVQGIALDRARTFNLHVSPTIQTIYSCFKIKWRSPHEERFNNLVLRMVEADVLEPWEVKCNPVKLEDYQIDADVKNNKEFKIIELQELTFAFVILGIGLTLASIVFIVELGIHYTCRRIFKVGIGTS